MHCTQVTLKPWVDVMRISNRVIANPRKSLMSAIFFGKKVVSSFPRVAFRQKFLSFILTVYTQDKMS